MADFVLIRELLMVAHQADAPEDIGTGEFDVREFTVEGGWTVAIYYDCGDLDYIDYFISPSGERLDLWGEELDSRLDDGAVGRSATLQCWRGKADTDRLLEAVGRC